MPWQIQVRRKKLGTYWEPVSIARAMQIVSSLGTTHERQFHYDNLDDVKLAFAAYVDIEGSLPDLIIRQATGSPRFTDVYDVRFIWMSEPGIVWSRATVPDAPKEQPPKESPTERAAEPDSAIDRLREQVVSGRGQLDRRDAAEIKRLRGELDAANQYVTILRAARVRAIASCLRACAKSITENRMEGPAAANYLDAYAATVIFEGEGTGPLRQGPPTSRTLAKDPAARPNSTTDPCPNGCGPLITYQNSFTQYCPACNFQRDRESTC